MADTAGSNGERRQFNVVGKRNLAGKLSYNLATGKAKFGIDATAPNMLHAKFLRSPWSNCWQLRSSLPGKKLSRGV